MLRRTLITLLAGCLLATAALMPAAAATPKRRGPVIKLRHTKIGAILVNGRGYTLYAFTPDTPRHDACEARFECLALWPAVVTRGSVQLGRGLKRSLLTTIRLRSGQRQVVYGGHPLYTYVKDRRPGEVDNVNIYQFGGYWPAVDAAGNDLDAQGHKLP